MTTRHLFLIFPAYLLAVYCAAWWDSHGFPNYHFAAAANDVRHFHLHLQFAVERDRNNILDADIINQWFDQTLPADHAAWRLLVERPCLDRWENPYRCVRDVSFDNGDFVPLGIYSTGRDGISHTNGNDPDDLKSWDEHSGSYYRAEIRNANRKQFAIQGAYLTPFTYGGLFGAIAGWKRFWRRTHFSRRIATIKPQSGDIL